MANTYDTSAYPLGSKAPKVVYNNASNFDEFVNSLVPTWTTRPPFLQTRRTLAGMEAYFNELMLTLGYTSIGDYDADGPLLIETYNQIFTKDGEFWRAAPPPVGPVLPYTTVNNWVIDAPKFVSVGDAVLRSELASPTGATLVARGASTVDADLTAVENLSNQSSARIDTLEITANAVPAVIANTGTAVAKNDTTIGDSILHGAFVNNTFQHGAARILNRMVNAELGASSYGYANWSTVGLGPTVTTEIHNVSFSAGWDGIDVTSAGAAVSPTGAAIRAPGVAATMTIGVPFFQNRGEMHYIQQPGGGTFTITVNGVLTNTVNTDGALAHGTASFSLTDAGYGFTTIVVTQTVAGLVDIVGPGYLAAATEPVFNNYAQSGRRMRYMSQYIIQKLMAESATFTWALGHNDQADGDSDNTYFAALQQVINWGIQYAKQYNVKVVVPDLCWTAPENSRTRGELRRLAKETGGVYVNLPKMIFSGNVPVSSTYLIDVLKMWVDASHPNKDGQKWMAESIARARRLSCTTKRDAIRFHDFWMPLPLQGATGVENGNLVSSSLSSSYKRNGSDVLVKLFIENSPSGAFPIGTYALTTGFNTKSELNLAQGTVGVGYVRIDTGATVSVWQISSAGALTINVLSAFVNDQIFSFNAPIAPGTL